MSSELKIVDDSAGSISVDIFSFSSMGLKMDRKRESARDFIHALPVLTHLYHLSRGQQSLSKFIQIPLVCLSKPTDERFWYKPLTSDLNLVYPRQQHLCLSILEACLLEEYEVELRARPRPEVNRHMAF